MPEIKYEITEHLGVISETARGWTREVNMISWNGREPKDRCERLVTRPHQDEQRSDLYQGRDR